MKQTESTWPTKLERPNGRIDDEHSPGQTGDAWSFGSRERLFAPRPPADRGNERSAAANMAAGSPTYTPPREMDVSNLRPVTSRRPFFGKRGFAAVYQWEGVVEEVNGGGGFRARLLPFEGGKANSARVEYADFDYEDLADDSDHELVVEGAVFYWTIGKSRNAAGTITNTSLVRFRRLPPPTASQMRQAAREAEALLNDLGS